MPAVPTQLPAGASVHTGLAIDAAAALWYDPALQTAAVTHAVAPGALE